jgi:hypothetical protein
MPSLIYDHGLLGALSGQINFATDQFRVALLSAAYRPDGAEHRTRDDVAAFEVSSDGYRGQQVSVAVGLQAEEGGNVVAISLGGAQWKGVSISARYAAYYRNAGAAADDELVAVIDFDTDITATNGTFLLSESVLYVQAQI